MCLSHEMVSLPLLSGGLLNIEIAYHISCCFFPDERCFFCYVGVWLYRIHAIACAIGAHQTGMHIRTHAHTHAYNTTQHNTTQHNTTHQHVHSTHANLHAHSSTRIQAHAHKYTSTCTQAHTIWCTFFHWRCCAWSWPSRRWWAAQQTIPWRCGRGNWQRQKMTGNVLKACIVCLCACVVLVCVLVCVCVQVCVRAVYGWMWCVCEWVYDYHIAIAMKPLASFESSCVSVIFFFLSTNNNSLISGNNVNIMSRSSTSSTQSSSGTSSSIGSAPYSPLPPRSPSYPH